MSIRFVGYGINMLHRMRVGSPGRGTPQLLNLDNAVCLPIVPQNSGAGRFTGGLYTNDKEYIEASGIKANGKMFVGRRDADWADELPTLKGRSLYLGVCHNHYGHFVIETISSRLWSLSPGQLGDFDHIVLLPLYGSIPSFVYEFFKVAGVIDRLRVIDRATRLEHVLLPFPAIHYPHQVNQAVKEVHRLFPVSLTEQDDRPLFLSRSALAPGYTRVVIGESIIEETLRRNGARIVRPEMHSLTEQVAIFRQHRTIIGFAGSALHTLVLSGGRKQVIAYSARRVPHVFPLLDQAMRNDACYIRAKNSLGAGYAQLKTGFQPEIINAKIILEVLHAMGLVDELPEIKSDDQEDWRIKYNTALLLRYVVEQSQSRSDDWCHDYVASFSKRYELDRVMLADAVETSPLLKKYF